MGGVAGTFTCWRDMRFKLKVNAPSADPERTDDVSYLFDDMYGVNTQRFYALRPRENYGAHMLRYIEDVDYSRFGNDDEQTMVSWHTTWTTLKTIRVST